MSNAKTVMSQAANTWAGPTFIEDVFSTYLYTGNGSTQTITNGIDLAGEGGLVWIKNRSSLDNHRLFTTDIGEDVGLVSNNTNGTSGNSGFDPYFDFTSSGFAFPAYAASLNTNGTNYASWTFRKAPRFFDVVTYTGTGSARTVSHNLGVAPGMVIVKRTNSADEWTCYHRSVGATKWLALNQTAAAYTSASRWNDTEPTDSVFTVGTDTSVNSASGTYVAYLFAHDPLGPSGDGSDGLIACGGFTTDASGNVTVDLGWEPQWLLVKSTNAAQDWTIVDTMRGWPVGNAFPPILKPNKADAEANSSQNLTNITPTGFQNYNTYLGGGNSYIYIAIRRGPMRQPTSGTEVFAVTTGNATSAPFFNSNWPVDFGLKRNTSADNWYVTSRMQGSYWLRFNDTNNENLDANIRYDYQNGWWAGYAGSAIHSWMFRRAPGFFDVVAYTGAGSATATNLKSHNLTVPPEMVIVKNRSLANTTWGVWHKDMNYNVGESYINKAFMYLNTTAAATLSSNYWSYNGNPQMDADYFSLGSTYDETNNPSYNYVAYLFATLPGVSKVGSYTGSSGSIDIDCGFTNGARFVLVKRTNSTGSWYLWDSARGIVSGNDPYLILNSTTAQITSYDFIDPLPAGFTLNTGSAAVNESGGEYIFLAIA